MPETYSNSDKPSQEVFMLGDKRLEMSSWDDAIAYAKRRVESLNAAIKVFKKHRDSGEPFSEPETAEKG